MIVNCRPGAVVSRFNHREHIQLDICWLNTFADLTKDGQFYMLAAVPYHSLFMENSVHNKVMYIVQMRPLSGHIKSWSVQLLIRSCHCQVISEQDHVMESILSYHSDTYSMRDDPETDTPDCKGTALSLSEQTRVMFKRWRGWQVMTGTWIHTSYDRSLNGFD